MRAGAHELGPATQTGLRHRTLPELRRFEETACQCKPTAPLALSSTERRDLQPRAHLRSPRRLRPRHPRPQLLLNSTTLDRLGALAVFLRSEKSGLKILSMARSAE